VKDRGVVFEPSEEDAMPAYFLVDILAIKDAAKMDKYRAAVAPIVEKFGGRYIVIGGPFQVVEGSYQPTFPVVIQFPTMNDARRWYDSEDYRELKNLRAEATVSNAFFMEGTPPSR
jgi:uncharacterized protein (DUF1330 family)